MFREKTETLLDHLTYESESMDREQEMLSANIALSLASIADSLSNIQEVLNSGRWE